MMMVFQGLVLSNNGKLSQLYCEVTCCESESKRNRKGGKAMRSCWLL